MISNLFPADELGELRLKMKALKAREAELRAMMIEAPDMCVGAYHEVHVKRQKSRVLRRELLPDHILSDPKMWRERLLPVVTVEPLESAEEFDVIERF